jgi:putative transposase
MQFERKKNRLDLEDYFGRKRFFVTTCCESRRAIFRNVKLATAAVECLREQSRRCSISVRAYCVMPDHVHFLAEGLTAASNLIRFVKGFKQATAYACRASVRGPLWEKSFYDHVLRTRDSGDSVAWYIWMNPVRKGLCEDPADYPFSGSFTAPWPTSQRAKFWTPPWKAKLEA